MKILYLIIQQYKSYQRWSIISKSYFYRLENAIKGLCSNPQTYLVFDYINGNNGNVFLLIKLNTLMSQHNSSLIGFLKKKSLFSTSPPKQIKNKQRSRDSQKTPKAQGSILNNPQLINQQSLTRSTNNLHQNRQHYDLIPAAESDSYLYNDNEIQNPIRYQASSPQLLKTQYSQRNFHTKAKQQSKSIRDSEEVKNVWSGIVTKVASFQSARIESIQCLQNLGFKIESQVSNINFKIDTFNSKMCQFLTEQLDILKQKMFVMIEKMFEQNEKNVKIYIKQQQKILADDLISVRESLLREHDKIQLMRQQINKPDWKKVAGELLSSDLQEKVQRMLLKSKSMSIKKWEMKDLGGGKLTILERQLKGLIDIGLSRTH